MKALYKTSILVIAAYVILISKTVSADAATPSLSNTINPILNSKLKTLLGPDEKFEIAPFNDAFDQVKVNNQVMLASKDGGYLFFGKVINTSTRTDMMEVANLQHRQTLISSIPREKLLTYSAKQQLHRITIFTDIDCPFCRKLHTQIKDLNQQGVTIDYVMIPRGQVGSKAFTKTVNTLCATNSQAAMDSAMHNGYFESSTQATTDCIDNLKAQQALAQTFGFSATPTILFANGEVVAGFINTQALLARLNSL
jgi:thiol:disulfide interchange protein DsbC